MMRVRPFLEDSFGAVWWRGGDDEAGEADEEDEVEQQSRVVNISAEAVPLVSNQCHAKWMAQQVLETFWVNFEWDYVLGQLKSLQYNLILKLSFINFVNWSFKKSILLFQGFGISTKSNFWLTDWLYALI